MNRLNVIAGPTAVGKGTVIKEILRTHPDFHLSVSATTREPRPGEVDGREYFFISMTDFDQQIANNQMLEYAVVHGTNKYGTPRLPVERALAQGQTVILEIDIQGAKQIKQAMPEARLIFIAPPSWDELVRRLSARGTESISEQQARLNTAKAELEAQNSFDFVVINDEVAHCAARIVELMQAD